MRSFKRILKHTTLLIGSTLAIGTAFAQAPVIDLNQPSQQQQPGARSYPTPTYPTPAYRSDMYGEPNLSPAEEIKILKQQMINFTQLDIPGKLDTMQQQIQELNGRLEVQAHHVETLTEQQKSFYQDLNQRLQEAQTVGTAGSLEISKGIMQAQGNVTQSISATDEDEDKQIIPTAPISMDAEEKAYQTAFSLLIKKQTSDAINAFEALLVSFPEGSRAAHTHYWLGELYSNEDKNSDAEEHLNILITKYPNDDKVPDALLKLAIIDDNNGQKEKAEQGLRQIIQKYPDSSAARLANMRLQQMMNTL